MRRQMYSKFLDAENFLDGNPLAAPTQELVSRYVVERMTALDADFAKFKLALLCESDGALLTARTIIASCDFRQFTYFNLSQGLQIPYLIRLVAHYEYLDVFYSLLKSTVIWE